MLGISLDGATFQQHLDAPNYVVFISSLNGNTPLILLKFVDHKRRLIKVSITNICLIALEKWKFSLPPVKRATLSALRAAWWR